ncbi:MAG: hypothetical protein QOH10_1533, partial [Actinomycetota bacterium]|nr:hypothetical protein [Actinomycetota bacterium]
VVRTGEIVVDNVGHRPTMGRQATAARLDCARGEIDSGEAARGERVGEEADHLTQSAPDVEHLRRVTRVPSKGAEHEATSVAGARVVAEKVLELPPQLVVVVGVEGLRITRAFVG